MRSSPFQTSAAPAPIAAVLVLAGFLAAPTLAGGNAPSPQEMAASTSAPAAPVDLLATIDAALSQGRPHAALSLWRAADPRVQQQPAFQGRAAEAWFQLGQVLGNAEVRAVPGGRAGQFADGWLLVEERPGRDQFLCCPPDSALFQLRRALDAGLDEPAAHVLHARIWQRLGQPQLGLSVLQAREATLAERADDAALQALCDLALDADALCDYLRYARLRADRQPQRRATILFDACLAAADRYCQRGDEALYIQWLYRAGRFKPDDAGILLRLADAEWDSGQPARAEPLYRRVLQVEPHHPQRPRILERLAAPPPSAP